MEQTAWGQLLAAPPSLVVRSPRTGGEYKGGSQAPQPGTLTVAQQRALLASGGTAITEEHGKELQAMGWTYGQPAPEGYHYSEHGVLEKDVSGWKRAGQIAGIAVPIIATAATAGAASPWLAASVGGAAALAGAKLQGASWKQALISGALGAAGGGISAAPVSTGVRTAANVGLGAAGGAMNGGGVQGALLGGASAGAAAATPAITNALAPAGSSPLRQAIAQVGTNAAIGGAFGGRRGALQSATTSAINQGFNTRAAIAAQRRNTYRNAQTP